MKQIFGYILMAAAGLTALAARGDDAYLPILVDGRSWVWEQRNLHESQKEPYVFIIEVCGDTIVNNVKCKKLRRSSISEDNNPYYMAAYEKDKHLYYHTQDFIEMHDFNLKQGDELEYKVENDVENSGFKVIKEDTVEAHGTIRRRLGFGYNSEVSFYWVEGIGAHSDSWITLIPMVPGNCLRMVECRDGDKIIFTYDDFFMSTAGVMNTVCDKQSQKAREMYDLSGKPVTSPRSGNIYIIDRKPILW